jgi:hypothetical protein
MMVRREWVDGDKYVLVLCNAKIVKLFRQIVMGGVAHPCAASLDDFRSFACSRNCHLVFDLGLLGNPDVLVFVRDSRIRD